MSTNKSFSTETSERYARALYEVSKESSDLEKIEADVKNFQSLFESNPEIKNFIQNPTHVIETQSKVLNICLLYTSPSPRDRTRSRMPSSA